MTITKKKTSNGMIEVSVKTPLYYSDYYSVINGEIHNDMGFYFQEQADTRNIKSLEENIADCKYNAKEYFAQMSADDCIENGEVFIFEVVFDYFECSDNFTEYEIENEIDDIEDFFPLWGMHHCEETEAKVVFRCATCSKANAEKLGLENIVGKIDYFIF